MSFGTADARHKAPGIGPLKSAYGVAVAASDIALRPHPASVLLSLQANGVNKKLHAFALQRITFNSLELKQFERIRIYLSDISLPNINLYASVNFFFFFFL